MKQEIEKKTDRHCSWLTAFCTAIIVSLAWWVISINGLGPIDDHQFIRTLYQGTSFSAYYSTELGRFFPLTAQEFVFASWLFDPSPRLFFGINAIKVIFLGVILHRCLILTKTNTLSIAVLWCVPLLSIGFANSAGRLHVGELNILLLTLLLIWSTLSIESSEQLRSTLERITDAASVAALVTAFFYKELVFAFALSFGAAELIRHYRLTRNIASTRLWALLIFGVFYIAGYSSWRALYCSGSYTSFQAFSILDLFLSFAGNDPFIIFIVLPLTAFRVVLIILKATPHTVYDSFLVAATTYTIAFALLGMYNTYYLLPTYGFAVCGVAGILALPSVSISYKRVLLGAAGIFCANTLPIALSDMQSLQLIANNHDRFVHALSEWVWKNPMGNQRPRRIALVGVTPGNGIEILISLKTFLVSLGTPESSFQVMTTEPTDNRRISTFYDLRNRAGYKREKGEVLYDIGKSAGYKPVKEDLLIFNPYQSVGARPPLLSPSYHEVLRSESELTIPRWSCGEWLQNSLRDPQTFKALLSANMRYSGYAALVLDRQIVQSPAVPLQSPSYRIGPINLPSRMRCGITRQEEILIENTGKEVWPSNGTLSPGMFVNISYRWFNANNQMILEGNRTPLPEPLLLHDMAKVKVILTTPDKPGRYKLIIGPVQEGVLWFPENNAQVIEIY